MAVLAARVHRERVAEQAQVERARERVAAERENEATALPTADQVRVGMRAALAPHIGQTLTVRLGRSGRGAETVDVTVAALYRAGALCRTGRGCPAWLAYHDLYAGHAAVLDPPTARDAMSQVVARLRRGAPRGDTR